MATKNHAFVTLSPDYITLYTFIQNTIPEVPFENEK